MFVLILLCLDAFEQILTNFFYLNKVSFHVRFILFVYKSETSKRQDILKEKSDFKTNCRRMSAANARSNTFNETFLNDSYQDASTVSMELDKGQETIFK